MSAHRAGAGAGDWVELIDEQPVYRFGRLFQVVEAQLRYRRFDGTLSETVTRIDFARGDSVGVLLYDPRADAVVLVRQFRYPAYASLSPEERQGDAARQAWLLEIVAGVQDTDLETRELGQKELLEEAGYQVSGELHPVASIYPSPGGSSERIHIFWAEVGRHNRISAGGGVVAEGEDTQVEVMPFVTAMAMIDSGEICDAKTIIALQHLALRKVDK